MSDVEEARQLAADWFVWRGQDGSDGRPAAVMPEHIITLDAALERAERELMEAKAKLDWWATDGIHHAESQAEARAQKAEAELVRWRNAAVDEQEKRMKAEAVVEAARETRHLYGKLDAALTAYDEPPTERPGARDHEALNRPCPEC